MTPDLFVVDTSAELITGEGSIDFREEKYDLHLKADSKTASILALKGPIVIGGTFKTPTVRPAAGPLAARIGASVGLAVLAPPLALLPLIDLGDAPDADCRALYQDARLQTGTNERIAQPQPAGDKTGNDKAATKEKETSNKAATKETRGKATKEPRTKAATKETGSKAATKETGSKAATNEPVSKTGRKPARARAPRRRVERRWRRRGRLTAAYAAKLSSSSASIPVWILTAHAPPARPRATHAEARAS